MQETLVHLVSAGEEQQANVHLLSQPATAPVLKLWTYREEAVVLGCSQHGWMDAPAGLDILPRVRRAAGGGAVLVSSGMLSVSILLPLTHRLVTFDTSESYRWLGHCFVKVLQSYRINACAVTPVQARQSQCEPARAKLRWACYGGLSSWEVVVDGRKIAGFAQVRRRTGVLLVAGLLLQRPDWPLLCMAMNQAADQAELLAECNTSMEQELGYPVETTDIASRLKVALQACMMLEGES